MKFRQRFEVKFDCLGEGDEDVFIVRLREFLLDLGYETPYVRVVSVEKGAVVVRIQFITLEPVDEGVFVLQLSDFDKGLFAK
ncbi:MAG: hypothetical protein QM571_02885 [Micrococcaceae bacterium]